MSATRDEVREAVAAEIYETFPRIQAPESPAPKWSDCKTRYRREWYRCADAAIAAAEQAGWVLVPVEADEAMWDAGRYQIVAGEGALDIWAAMIAAAPKVTP